MKSPQVLRKTDKVMGESVECGGNLHIASNQKAVRWTVAYWMASLCKSLIVPDLPMLLYSPAHSVLRVIRAVS